MCLLKLSTSQNGCAVEFHNFYFHPERTKPNDWNYSSKQVEIFPEVFERENQGNTSISLSELVSSYIHWKRILSWIGFGGETLNLNSGNLFGFIVDVVKPKLRNFVIYSGNSNGKL